MNEKDFCNWLNGFAELNKHAPSEKQWEMIKEHLNLALKKDKFISQDYLKFWREPLPMTADGIKIPTSYLIC